MNNNKSSRFSTVPPPSTASTINRQPMKLSVKNSSANSANDYFSHARQKNEKMKNYFDDDDDVEEPIVKHSLSKEDDVDDDYDPLDAFM